MSLTQIKTGGVDDNINIDSNTLKVDGTNNRVGIGTAAPNALLEVNSTTAGNEVQRIEGTYSGSGSVVLTNWRRAGGAVAANFQYHDSPIKMSFGTTTSHTLALKTANTNRLTIDSSGNVGINNSSPSSYNSDGRNLVVGSGSGGQGLSIASGTGNYGTIYFADGTSGDALYRGAVLYNHASDFMRFDTAAGERLRIDSSGRLGVGTSSPSFTLDIAAATATIRATSTTGANLAFSAFKNTGGNLYVGRDRSAGGGIAVGSSAYAGVICVDSAHPLQFATSNTVRATIDSSGKVLIGDTVGGGANLNVYGTSSATVYQNANTGTGNTGNGMFVGNWGSTTAYLYNYENDSIIFGTNNAEKMRLASNGLLGVGTSSPETLLHVSWAAGSPQLTLQRTGTATGKYSLGAASNEFAIKDEAQNAERFRINGSGIVCINRTSVIHGGQISLDYTNGTTAGIAIKDKQTSGTGVALQIVNGSGSIVGSITQNQSTTAFNTSSDYRLKENVVDIANGITRVKQLSPRRFNFIADDTVTVDGFIAHEAQAVVPEAVTGEKDGEEMQGIDQSKLVPLLTAALQEAISKIETLEAKVAALEAG